jgi:hypothetical protein
MNFGGYLGCQWFNAPLQAQMIRFVPAIVAFIALPRLAL